MTSTFRGIFLVSSVSQSAGRQALRQVDLGPTSLDLMSLLVLPLLRYEDRHQLEYTSGMRRRRAPVGWAWRLFVRS